MTATGFQRGILGCITPKRKTRQSCGVMAVTTHECQRLRLPVEADGAGFPEHVSIDCSALTTRRQIETNAKRLRAAANARGWQFQP